MVVVLRYVLLLALGFGSLLAFLSAVVTTGELMVFQSGGALSHPNEISLWVLLAICVLGFYSLSRFVFRGLPKMISHWFTKYKDRIATVILAVLVCLIFVVT